MKSLEQQISDKCIHFNGVMNDCCKVGVKYADVRVGRPYQFPCFKDGSGFCSKTKFPTQDEVKIRVAEIKGMSDQSLTAYAAIKNHFNETGDLAGKIKCECGDNLFYRVAQSNGHIWASCSGCGISFAE